MSCENISRGSMLKYFRGAGEQHLPFHFSGSKTGKFVIVAEFGIFIALLVVWMVIIYRNRKRKFLKGEGRNKRKIPVVSYFPIWVPDFVNGFYLLYKVRKDGMQFVDEVVSKFGNFFEQSLGIGTAIVVSDPVIAQKILSSTNPLHLNKPRYIYDVLLPDAFKDGLIVSEHDVWCVHRKVLARSFTFKSLQTYLPLMNEHGKSLANKLVELCSPDTGDKVNGKQVDDLIWSETIKIIIQTLLGDDFCSDEESREMHHNFKRGKEITQYRFLHPELMIGAIWWLHPMRKELDGILKSLKDMISKHVRKFRMKRKLEEEKMPKLNETCSIHKEIDADSDDDNEAEENNSSCLMEEMLLAGASNKEVFDELGTFISAGHETTTVAISQLLFHLASNQECQTLCRDEIDQLLGSDPASDPDYNLSMEDLSNMKYVERCIFESLRLTPTIPAFLRRLDAPLKIDEDLTLDKGRTILLSPWAIHRDPAIYPDPQKFDPDRFLPENVKGRHAYAFMPFSGGPRKCIGYKYGVLEIKVIVGWLLRNFEVYTSDDPKKVKYFLELTIMLEKDINLILRRRR